MHNYNNYSTREYLYLPCGVWIVLYESKSIVQKIDEDATPACVCCLCQFKLNILQLKTAWCEMTLLPLFNSLYLYEDHQNY